MGRVGSRLSRRRLDGGRVDMGYLQFWVLYIWERFAQTTCPVLHAGIASLACVCNIAAALYISRLGSYYVHSK